MSAITTTSSRTCATVIVLCATLTLHASAGPSMPAAASGSEPALSQTGSAPPLEGTYWRAIELGGKPLRARDASREAFLMFGSSGRASGSDGCNRLRGTYALKGDAVTFGDMAATRKMCPKPGDTEATFRDALKAATRWRIADNRLELFDAAGARVAIFEAQAQALPPGGFGSHRLQVIPRGSSISRLA